MTGSYIFYVFSIVNTLLCALSMPDSPVSHCLDARWQILVWKTGFGMNRDTTFKNHVTNKWWSSQ